MSTPFLFVIISPFYFPASLEPDKKIKIAESMPQMGEFGIKSEIFSSTIGFPMTKKRRTIPGLPVRNPLP
jgi:hypothetical protein